MDKGILKLRYNPLWATWTDCPRQNKDKRGQELTYGKEMWLTGLCFLQRE